jgi:hypothetical protein
MASFSLCTARAQGASDARTAPRRKNARAPCAPPPGRRGPCGGAPPPAGARPWRRRARPARPSCPARPQSTRTRRRANEPARARFPPMPPARACRVARACTSCASASVPKMTKPTRGRPARSSGLRRGERAKRAAAGCSAIASARALAAQRRARRRQQPRHGGAAGAAAGVRVSALARARDQGSTLRRSDACARLRCWQRPGAVAGALQDGRRSGGCGPVGALLSWRVPRQACTGACCSAARTQLRCTCTPPAAALRCFILQSRCLRVRLFARRLML